MLSLTCIILVLIQSAANQSTSKSKLYKSDYWTSTYATDIVPDYWNHGPIYLPELPNKHKQSIFPAWLTSPNMKLYSSKVTNDTSKSLTATDNVFFERAIETVKTPGALDFATTPTSHTGLNSTIPSVITSEGSKPRITKMLTTTSTPKQNNISHPDYGVTLDDKSRPYPISTTHENIFTTTVPAPEKVHVMHPEHETTFDNNSRPYPIAITITQENISTTTEAGPENIHITQPEHETIFDDDPQPYPIPAILTKGNIFTTTVTAPEKINVTRPEPETAFDDDPKPYPITTIITQESIFTTTPIAEKIHGTHPEYETPFDDDPQPYPITTMITQESIFTTTPIPETIHGTHPEYETPFDDDPQPYPTPIITTVQPTRLKYDTTVDYTPHSTRMTVTQASSPRYEKKIDYYDIELAKMTLSTMAQILTPKEYESLIRAVDRDITSDPFSIFLHKMLILLSMKKVEDLPTLVNQFKEYTSMLLTNGTLGPMGWHINSYIAQRVLILDTYPIKALSKFFSRLHKKFGNRQKEFAKDVNDILDYMDDTYDEGEEEAMQAVLRETSLYPNSRNNNKIAQGFVDYIFLKPMQRITDTVRGNTLFDMMTDALKKRDPFMEKHGNPVINKLFRKNIDLRKTINQQRDPADSEKKDKLNKLQKAKQDADSQGNIDRSDNLSPNHKITTISRELNEYSEKKEKRYKSEAIKFNEFMNYQNIRAKNTRKQRKFSNVNKIPMKNNNISGVRIKLKTPRYSKKSKYLNRDHYVKVKQNTIQYKRQSRTSDSITKERESSDIEMELKAKIYEALGHMLLAKTSASSVRNTFSSTTNLRGSYESDADSVLKKNIYKWVKQLFTRLAG